MTYHTARSAGSDFDLLVGSVYPTGRTSLKRMITTRMEKPVLPDQLYFRNLVRARSERGCQLDSIREWL